MIELKRSAIVTADTLRAMIVGSSCLEPTTGKDIFSLGLKRLEIEKIIIFIDLLLTLFVSIKKIAK